MSALWTGLVGIVGVLIGVLLNEMVRRRNRREAFAPKIFEKRLAAYEGLFDCVHECDREFAELLITDCRSVSHGEQKIDVAFNRFVDEIKRDADRAPRP